MRQFTKYPTSYVKASIDPEEAEARVIVSFREKDGIIREDESDYYTSGEAYADYRRWCEDVDSPNPNSGSAEVVKVEYYKRNLRTGKLVLIEEKTSSNY